MPVATLLAVLAAALTAVDWLLMAVLWLPWLPLTSPARLCTAGMLVVVAAETVLQQTLTAAGRGRAIAAAHPGAALAAALVQLAVVVLFAGFVITLGMQFRAAFRRRTGRPPTRTDTDTADRP